MRLFSSALLLGLVATISAAPSDPSKDCCDAKYGSEVTQGGCEIKAISDCVTVENLDVACLTAWDFICVEKAVNLCHAECPSLIAITSPPVDVDLPTCEGLGICEDICSLLFEPVCVNDLYTSCNRCTAECEQLENGIPPNLLTLVDGECDTVCTRENPCQDPLICYPTQETNPITFPGDPSEYRCLDLDCDCSGNWDPVCILTKYQNPGLIKNQCIANTCFGITETFRGNCAHICDEVGVPKCPSSRRCTPHKDSFGQSLQDEFRCIQPNCACPPEEDPVCAYTPRADVQIDLPNRCVAECEGFTNIESGTCPLDLGQDPVQFAGRSGTTGTPLDVYFPGALAFTMAEVVKTCSCDVAEWDPVCANKITFSSPCYATCVGNREKDMQPGECDDPCNSKLCPAETYCVSPFPGFAQCISEPQGCECPRQPDAVCITVGDYSFNSHNSCTAACSGFDDTEFTLGGCEELKYAPLTSQLQGPTEDDANDQDNCADCRAIDGVWQEDPSDPSISCHRFCDDDREGDCFTDLCPVTCTVCCMEEGQAGCCEDKLEEAVCGLDSYCCDSDWDSTCVEYANNYLFTLSSEGGNPADFSDFCTPYIDLFVPCTENPCVSEQDNKLAACAPDNVKSSEIINAKMNVMCTGGDTSVNEGITGDTYCCKKEWDDTCTNSYNDNFPETCQVLGDHSCCEEGGPGCDDSAIQTAVCTLDNFCCLKDWDATCVAAAACSDGPVCNPDGCELLNNPACRGEETPPELQALCANDPFCCDEEFDGQCQNWMINTFPLWWNTCQEGPDWSEPLSDFDCCNSPEGAPDGVFGCKSSKAQLLMCRDNDSFCCTKSWDSFCAGKQTEEMCPPAGLDWGDDCDSGTNEMIAGVKFKEVISVGFVPANKANLTITLTSDVDLDVQLIDVLTGKPLIRYHDDEQKAGLLNDGGYDCADSEFGDGNEISFCWSGWQGTFGNKGNEFITVSGNTNRETEILIEGFETGIATVWYSWEAMDGCISEGCGEFNQLVEAKVTVDVGTILVGMRDVRINLESLQDVDIQIFDVLTGFPVVAWDIDASKMGLCNIAGECCRNFCGPDETDDGLGCVDFCYSGWQGERYSPAENDYDSGKEYLAIAGRLERELSMRAFAYEKGQADIKYRWGMDDPYEDKFAFDACPA